MAFLGSKGFEGTLWRWIKINYVITYKKTIYIKEEWAELVRYKSWEAGVGAGVAFAGRVLGKALTS